jgi:hypothetical protein
MEIGKAFSFILEDEKWVNKVLIGAVVSAIPIANFAASGYAIDVMQNTIQDETRPLPSWDDFGRFFVRGFKWLLGLLLYLVPIIILSCLFAALGGGMSAVMGDSRDAADALGMFASGVGLLVSCLVLLYSLAVGFIIPAATARYALTDDLMQMFRFRELFADIRRNLNGYVVAYVVMLVASIVIGAILSLFGLIWLFIPICGWIIAWVVNIAGTFYLQLAYSNLFGQYFKEARPTGLDTKQP